MPYVRIEPDIFLEHKGVEVFHTYDEGDSYQNHYWFTTNPDNADEFRGHGNAGQFDVRRFTRLWEGTPNVDQWKKWWQPRFRSEEEAIEALIEAEIDTGRLKATKEKGLV